MITMNNGFVLTDIAGIRLTSEDRDIIQHPAIFGILLFAKNYESPNQLTALTTEIHRLNPEVIIMVDQEGGRVQRFVEGFSTLHSMSHWGRQYDQGVAAAFAGLRQQTTTMVTELQRCGVQVSLAPVLDVDYQMSRVIGERSFHQNPAIISQLAKCVIDSMHDHKMPVIGKHFPGHGAVSVDSHLSLPVDNRPWGEIFEQDMKPYRDLVTDLDAIMPAHIIYSAIDSKPAGFSSRWISEILRNKLNYQGLVITDDLTMQAAAVLGDCVERAVFSLEAGCDILTICHNRKNLIQVIDNIDNYSNPSTHNRIIKYISIMM